MTYQEVIAYLFSQLPVYQNQGASAVNYKLDKITAICERLGNPHQKIKTIHVAGTNGKGSTSHFIASILQENGYKVGLYTSPHLKSFTERVRVNGIEITEQAVIDFVVEYKAVFEEYKPSFFEWTVALAFHQFAVEKVDLAVIEVGMGGRLDSTNIITPLISVITNIGLDHQQFLGTCIYQIAKEKAGIIKPGVPVLVSETQKETTDAFKEVVLKNNARIKWVDQSSMDYLRGLELDSPSYLLKNAQTACHTVIELEKAGYKINYATFYDGLKNVTKNTGLKGRWQQIGSNPLVICDTGHNEDGIKQVVANLKLIDYKSLHVVLGAVKDKDINSVLALLPKEAKYYWCKPKNDRALEPLILQQKGNAVGLVGEVYESIPEAIQAAKNKAQKDDLIFIGGSNFVVAEIEEL